MADSDPAFLWETEALRATGPGARESGRHARPEPADARPGWVTLRQASDATGIPVATLRSWIRKKRVPSVLDETPNGDRRMVPLDRVLARADQLGREVEDLGLSHEEPASGKAATTPTVEAPPPGTMIVPIEAWDKMLLQLGNLHEAGQQLAEARERAARAETEATFLKERLAELRAENATRTAVSADQPLVEAGPSGDVTGRPSFSAYLWRSTLSRLRRL
jgi:hypothetical protein